MTTSDLIALATGVLDTGATSTGGDYPEVLAALNAKYAGDLVVHVDALAADYYGVAA